MISFGIEFNSIGAVAEIDLSKNDALDIGTAKEPLDADRRLRLCTSETGFYKMLGCLKYFVIYMHILSKRIYISYYSLLSIPNAQFNMLVTYICINGQINIV